MEDLRYPIGRFDIGGVTEPGQLAQWIADISVAPAKLRAATRGLSPEQLDTPYREGGWTVRQLVHHVPDSHMNAYVRFRLALTETEPTIKPYEESRWAELPDARTAPLDVSLSLLDSLHERWTLLLRSLSADEWRRTFRHPELGLVSLDRNAGLYSWHGRHHVAHVLSLRKRMGWL